MARRDGIATGVGTRHPSRMSKKEIWGFGLLPIAGLLASCDPGVHLAWKDQFKEKIDRNCVDSAVKSVAGKASLASYVSDGVPFPKGTQVYQILYDAPFNDKLVNASVGYRIDIAPMPDGSTSYYHEWGKLGTSIEPQERDYVILIMAKINAAVAERCGISVGNGKPAQGDG